MAFRVLSKMVVASRAVPSTAVRAAARPVLAVRRYAEEASPEEFDAKWVAYFSDEGLDSREIRRGLNDVFAHDLVPEPKIIAAALNACRRVDDYATTIRIFEAVKDKAPNDETYQYVVGELKPTIDELGLSTPEELNL